MGHFHCYVVLLILAMTTTAQAIWVPLVFRRFHVQIENGLAKETLWAHCKSGDDDLQVRQLGPQGQFNWAFKLNIRGTTLYFCHLWWNGGQHSYESFKANDKLIQGECGGTSCIWQAREDGIYLKHGKGDYKFKYAWDKWPGKP